MKKTFSWLRASVVIFIICTCVLIAQGLRDVPEPHEPSMTAPQTADASSAARSRTRTSAPTRPTLHDACDDFADSDGTSEDEALLMQFALFWIDLESMIHRCGYESDTLDDLLTGDLLTRLEDGDREAARLMYHIAGSTCPLSPRQIDRGCEDDARANDLPMWDWRTCIREGYEVHGQCALARLREAGVDPSLVYVLYLRDSSEQLMDLAKRARTPGEDDDPSGLIRQLEMASRDRVLVESVTRSGELSFHLFSLQAVVRRTGDEEDLQRVSNLLLFWGQRAEMETYIAQGDAMPYRSSIAPTTP